MTDNPNPTDQAANIRRAEDGLTFATGKDFWTTQKDSAFGMRSLRFADGPHGLRVQNDENPDHLGLERSLPATCFPPAVTLASSWDETLVESVGAALGLEAKVAGVDVLLGPGLNIKRSPLCGRNFEYYSEDPLLSGSLAGAAARGIQSQGVAACLKHFTANTQETDRHRISANMDERTLREIYLRNFEIALDVSGAWSIMTSYNRINGTHVSQDPVLLTDILRDEWKFDGVVISDWGGVYEPVAAFKAGMDIRMPGRPDDMRLKEAFRAEEIDEAKVDQLLGRVRKLADRTKGPAPDKAVDYEAHHALVRRAAAESAVLLKNNGCLPVEFSKGKKIAVLGALAAKPRYQGAGSSRVNSIRLETCLDALTRRAELAGASIKFAPAYSLTEEGPQTELIQTAVSCVHDADIALIFLGLPDAFEAEGTDRTHIDLPQCQIALINALKETNSPKIVSLMNGSVVRTRPWSDHVDAVLELWLTGQAQGETAVDLLLGDADPGGRLAETIPLKLEDTPAYLNFPGEYGNVTHAEGIYLGYRFYDARQIEVEYPFGHGLSYTKFAYQDLQMEVHPSDSPIAFTARITIANIGLRSGSDVVQLYVEHSDGDTLNPPRELRAWKKVKLTAGEARVVRLEVKRKFLEHWNSGSHCWSFPGGNLYVHIGASSRDIRLTECIKIPGDPVPVHLNPWSCFGEWLDHPIMGKRIQALLEERGGTKGRAADLLNDPVGRKSIGAIPFASIAEFPGIPIYPSDLGWLCDEATSAC
ncbi:glycoside hydrolase family 3 C-terminal domain-containing protein [uncultured Cohaesibacter sp.]|uniref:beta-glucosidase family protein n=1 Tax=uncultured Cohaesibacter sp. TaxID=1002546 RepID=UPI00293043FE|nr:glycoside hydrolase family 3 C-terminal domain-containing protein [uncultured Cohaesibacter sp.]